MNVDAIEVIHLQSAMRMILTLATFADGEAASETKERILREIRKLAREALKS